MIVEGDYRLASANLSPHPPTVRAPEAPATPGLFFVSNTGVSTELRRLVGLWRAYKKSDEGDAKITEGKVEEALAAYSEAARLAPGNDELLFWQAATLWKLGREKEATPLFKKVFAKDPRWVKLAPRLVPADLLPNDPESIQRIQALAPHGKTGSR